MPSKGATDVLQARADEVRLLIEQLSTADRKLDQLLGGEVDAVCDASGRTILLSRAQAALRQSDDARHAAVLNTLPAQVAVLDADGAILTVNEGWRQFARHNNAVPASTGPGQNYLAVCDRAAAAGSDEALRAAAGLRRVLGGDGETFTMEYPCHSPTAQRWFLLRAAGVDGATEGGAVVMHIDITEKKQSEQALQRLSQATAARERLLSTMLESIPDLAYAVDRNGRLLYANRASLALWGLAPEQAAGKTVHDIGYPLALADRVQSQFDQVFATGKTLVAETPFTDQQGRQHHYEYVFSPAFTPDGTIDFTVGCSRDVTARKQSEQALRNSVTEFRSLAAATPQIVWTATAQGEFIYLNEQWTEFTGRSVADGLGQRWFTSVHPEDRPAVLRAHDEALRSGHGVSMEAQLLRRDGTPRWFIIRAVPVCSGATVLKWIGTFTDVDELKTAELRVTLANRELQRQRTELRTLFDLVPAMVWFMDLDGRVLQINSRAAAMANLTVEAAVGSSFAEVFPHYAALYPDSDLPLLQAHRPMLGRIERSTLADGSQAWFQSDLVPLHDNDGSIRGIMVMKHDITERKRVQDALSELNTKLESRVRERTAELALAREEAERANDAKSAFLAAMSHEIRTPMAGLLGLLELLELTQLDPEQHSTLALARSSGQNLKQIIDGILDFTKIEAHSLELALAPGSLAQIVENVVRLHTPVAAGKGLVLRTTMDAGLARSHLLDALRLNQILGNLLTNAIKFTETGTVSVHVELAGRSAQVQRILLHVRDTGIGIAPEKLGRLFKPYGQADARTGTLYGGTGLGLFIARQLTELMNGTLTLESEPGVGSTLTVALDLQIFHADQASSVTTDERHRLESLVARRPAPPSAAQAEADGRLLLVVDDHPINRMLLLRQARTLGWAAEAAADGMQALEAWASGRFGAILTDCNMPRMNGFELAREIRAREAGSRVRTPIIGCTANAMAAATQECIAAGMDDVVTKPVDLESLCARLDRWLPLLRPPSGDDLPDAETATARLLTGASEGLLDLALINAIANGDPAVGRRVAADFQRSNDADAATLREAVSRGDLPEVIQASHRLRGASSMMGAALLADGCAALQSAAASGVTAEVDAAMGKVETELLRLGRYLGSLA